MSSRKTIMVSAKAHQRLRALAQAHRARMPDVLDALLDCVSETDVAGKLAAIAHKRDEGKKQRLAARVRLEPLFQRLGATELDALVEELKARFAREGRA